MAGKRKLGCQVLQFLVVAIDKGRTFEKVLRKVAAQAKLGKNGKVGASLFGLLRQAQDASRISCEIAYGGIELRERYLHARTLEYGWRTRIANSGANCPCRRSSCKLDLTLPSRLLRNQARNSLPGVQLPIKNHVQLWKSSA